MPTSEDELDAQIRETEALMQTMPPEQRRQLESSIESLRATRQMLANARSQSAELDKTRHPLSPEMTAFFAPDPVPAIPTWIPDTLGQRDVTDAMMRCPVDAKIYRLDTSISCGIPRGGGIPTAHGLDLGFHHDGSLKSQDFYESDHLKWSIAYHVTRGRAREGFYADRERMQYREQGLITKRDPNGTIVTQQWFEAGVPHGWQKMWEADGYAIGATRYDHGKVVEQVYPNGERRTT